jgi:glucose/arabinose dehydrogenase
MKILVTATLLLTLVPAAARAQINAGEQAPDPNVPFTMTQVATFNVPWRMAFLPDGRMLVTEKVGPVWLVTHQGSKTPIDNVLPVPHQGQGGMLGVFVSPHYAKDQSVYLTYAEPGDGGSSLALARVRLAIRENAASFEHGPRGGDELHLIEPGKNYGWPLVSYATNYNRTPIPHPDTRPDLTKPVIYWTPIIGPGNFMFYKGNLFKQWQGSALIGGLETQTLSRVTFDGKGGAKPAERWNVGHRIRDVAVAPDGALWMVEDADPGGLFRVTPK